MTNPTRRSSTSPNETPDFGHPRGTLAIVLLFGLLFGFGWFAMYVFEFLKRGAPHS